MDSARGLEPDYSRIVPCFDLEMAVYHQRDGEDIFARSRRLLLEQVRCHSGPNWHYFVEYGERLGRLDEVVATFEELYPHLFADPPYDLEKDNSALYATGLALLRHGDFSRGEPLMRAFVDYWEKLSTIPDLTDITAFLALDDREAALEVLRTFARNKWYYSGTTAQLMFRYSLLFDPIRDEPEFIALLETWEQNAAEQDKMAPP